jgi:hypothetical protein
MFCITPANGHESKKPFAVQRGGGSDPDLDRIEGVDRGASAVSAYPSST